MEKIEFEKSLQTTLTFWKQIIDETNGGFYGEISIDLIINKHALKGSVINSRYLWAYAHAYRLTRDPQWLQVATHAFTFLRDTLFDATNNGVYWTVKDSGQPLNCIKHLYAQSFAIYGLSEYFLATQDHEALRLANSLFKQIETIALNSTKTGYHEEFTPDWQPKPITEVGAPQSSLEFTTNTHLHLLEAYTNLYLCEHQVNVRTAIQRLLWIFKHHIYQQVTDSTGYCAIDFDEHWQPLTKGVSYGHDIETSWLLDETLKLTKIRDPEIEEIIDYLANYTYGWGINSEFHSLDEDKIDDVQDKTKTWWVQAEAVTGFYNMFERHHDLKFEHASAQVWQYIKINFLDPRPNSEWFSRRDAQNNLLSRLRHNGTSIENIGDLWKGPYHTVRLCTEMIKRLEQSKND